MMKLSIVTPERRVVGPVSVASVTVPGTKGEMTVLPGHARLLTTLETGILSFELEGGKKDVAAMASGFMEVSNDNVTILAEALELAHEIDVDKARREKDQAEDMLKAKDHFKEDMQKWQRQLQLSLIRLEAAEYLLPPH